MEEDGLETQESSSIEPPSSTTHVGEQKGANKRIHDKIVALGHKTHPSQSQRMGNVAGSNPTGSINANLASISQSQASAPTPITKPTFKNAPSTSGILASAPSAHLGQPENPFSPVGIGRQRLLYDVNRCDVPTQDEFYGSSRNDDFYGKIHNNDRKARFVTGRSKGKGKPSKNKGMRNATPKDWDHNMTTIPEFGSSLGITFFSLSETLSGMTDYPISQED
jgi:hypothetical protein